MADGLKRADRSGHVTLEQMLERNMTPRERLENLVAQRGETYAGLSRWIGRPEGYLQRFVAEGVPSRLRSNERDLLARYFGVTRQELGG